ncbi:hypothetical protein Vadar_003669 [Vaccinium darrowii]|uniref:Uncharacterized protein n=1 Tax=Vaccinium darrowii TaxID=229202 RepID=A0ACB7XF92_9ERIC|nr:hypothetical protein Vadar_003669 [Vaccinium darrowii]
MEGENTEKRKQRDTDGEVLDGKRTRVGEDNGVKKTEEPDDDEVEEFFAILRRIRVAVEYFQKGRRPELAAKESSSRRSPSFLRRDFVAVDGVKGQGEEEGDTGLDLNAEPDSDSEPNPVNEPDV